MRQTSAMMRTLPANRRATNEGKSFYRLRFLAILWAVSFSMLISYALPSDAAGKGYDPVYQQASVKGAHTVNRASIVIKPGFVNQEITSQKFVPTPTPTVTPTSTSAPQKDWGKSRQIGEYTWTIDVPDDERAATAQEIFQALNAYRQKNGKGTLQWDDHLAEFARSRSDLFASQGKTDSHAGFKDYLNNQDGFNKLGYRKIGENSSFGYKVMATHLIENVYGGDKPHDDNQLSGDWTAVGIGVNGLATNLIFAGQKI